jgi:hypothetical protein
MKGHYFKIDCGGLHVNQRCLNEDLCEFGVNIDEATFDSDGIDTVIA